MVAAPRAGATPPPRCCHHVRSRRRATSITDARARQIQIALVKAGYLHHVSGYWNRATRQAMMRYQRDHHWQTRWVPDSRALIALGLGPKRDEPPHRPAASRAAATAAAKPPASSPPAHTAPAPSGHPPHGG
ncbi:MAG: peptidoglycan-binding domain-containing protein [Terriglobales bacterium]